MKNDATNTAERLVLAGAARPSAGQRECASPWQGGADRAAHVGHQIFAASYMTVDVTKLRHRWPGDPPS